MPAVVEFFIPPCPLVMSDANYILYEAGSPFDLTFPVGLLLRLAPSCSFLSTALLNFGHVA